MIPGTGHTHTCACLRTNINTHAHTYTHTITHAHTRTCAHTHTTACTRITSQSDTSGKSAGRPTCVASRPASYIQEVMLSISTHLKHICRHDTFNVKCTTFLYAEIPTEVCTGWSCSSMLWWVFQQQLIKKNHGWSLKIIPVANESLCITRIASEYIRLKNGFKKYVLVIIFGCSVLTGISSTHVEHSKTQLRPFSDTQ